jgi:N-formylglutamate deformylase
VSTARTPGARAIAAQAVEGVLTVIPPRVPPVPLVFDSPHSGTTIPADFRPAVSPDLVLTSADTHVDALFDFAPDLGAPLLAAHFPRSFLDVNRSLLDMDLALVDGAWPDPVRDSPSARRGMGLIWRYAWGDRPMYDRPLTVDEIRARIDRYWRPYHAALRELIEAGHRRFGRVYHVNCHSMPERGHKLSPDPEGSERADIVLGDRDGTSCEPGFVRLVETRMLGFGYTVAINRPFKGAELVAAYSDPARGRHSLQIEINRRLYMDEATRARTAGFTTLRAQLAELGAAMRSYAVDAANRA